MRRLCSLAAITAGLSACAVRVSGDLDGDAPASMQSAFFGQTEQSALGVTFGILWVFGASFGFDCATVDDYLDVLADADADDIVEFETERFPETYWKMNLAFSADDDLEDFVGEDFEQGTSNSLGLTICHVEGYPEEQGGAVDRDEDCFYADDGDVTVTEFVDEERLGFNAERPIDLDDEDGDSTGEMTVSGGAPHCEPISDAMDDGSFYFPRWG